MSESIQDRRKRQEHYDRTIKVTITYLGKCEWGLYPGEHGRGSDPVHHGYHGLLDKCLDLALNIIEHLPDDFFREDDTYHINDSDDPNQAIAKLEAAMKDRRKVITMDSLRRVIKHPNTGEHERENAKAKLAAMERSRESNGS